MSMEEKRTHILLIMSDGEQVPCALYALSKSDYIAKVRQCIEYAKQDGQKVVAVKCVSKYIFSIEEPIELFVGGVSHGYLWQ